MFWGVVPIEPEGGVELVELGVDAFLPGLTVAGSLIAALWPLLEFADWLDLPPVAGDEAVLWLLLDDELPEVFLVV